MAKTNPTNTGDRQAATNTYSAESLAAAARSIADDQKRELLKKAGILSADGRLSKAYRNWGTKVSRTEASPHRERAEGSDTQGTRSAKRRPEPSSAHKRGAHR